MSKRAYSVSHCYIYGPRLRHSTAAKATATATATATAIALESSNHEKSWARGTLTYYSYVGAVASTEYRRQPTFVGPL